MKKLLLLLLLSSCSSTYLFKQYKKKGGKIEQVEKTVTVTDTLTINGKDTVIYRTVKVECPDPIIETRWKVRFDNKRFNDSLKHLRRIDAIRLDNALKVSKTNVKVVKSNNNVAKKALKAWNFWDKLKFAILMLVVGYLLHYVVRLVKSFV